MTIGLALHGHDVARRGPDWGLWDVMPIMPLVLLVVGFVPIVWLEMTATTKFASKREELHGAVEATTVQAGAILVSALTGQAPWL